MGRRMAGSPDQVQMAADEQPNEKRSVDALAVASAASHDLVGDISAARMAISLASSAEVGTDKSVALLADAGDLLEVAQEQARACLLYTSPSPRDGLLARMPSSA